MNPGFRTAFRITLREQNRMGRRTVGCESHVCEPRCTEQDPEYRGTRETPWEDGETTLQA